MRPCVHVTPNQAGGHVGVSATPNQAGVSATQFQSLYCAICRPYFSKQRTLKHSQHSSDIIIGWRHLSAFIVKFVLFQHFNEAMDCPYNYTLFDVFSVEVHARQFLTLTIHPMQKYLIMGFWLLKQSSIAEMLNLTLHQRYKKTMIFNIWESNVHLYSH